HSNAYRKMPMFFNTEAIPVLKAICGRTEKAVAEAARKFGWESYETSWEKLVKRKDIDLVDITTPNSTHKDIVLAAAAEGKDILCEKPLAMSLQEAEDMLRAVEEAGVKHMVCFNYRKVPAIALAKKFIDEEKLGRIYHFRAIYLQDWISDPDFPLVWRLRKELAGSGAHGDLNSHIIDLARYLVGEFDRVIGMQETFIKKRPRLKETEDLTTGLTAEAAKEMGEVTVDDTTLFLAKFKNGAVGSFEATRFAPGRRNYQRIEINGSKGSILFELEDMNKLWFYSCDDPDNAQGFRRIQVTEQVHPYINAWWPPGHIIGYEHTFVHVVYDFMRAIDEEKNPSPSFRDGVECQRVMDAVEKSIREGRWVKVKQ
ncbi:MAG: gfo/Idh/MocA family oxidoreductase, partial [Spirochaetes bacterium]